ncbi:hypothetical protein DENSPDRAFT_410281 [Dentipellis sp. KUC8613]|nr:hypothetical protein DENSPDRAFT_410281 [Dentipellis sp. KUC8613]
MPFPRLFQVGKFCTCTLCPPEFRRGWDPSVHHGSQHDGPEQFAGAFARGDRQSRVSNFLWAVNARRAGVDHIVFCPSNQAGLEFVKFWDCLEMSIVELKAF